MISPILANIYLHEVLDKWWTEEVVPRLRGRALLVRYADDAVLVFSDEQDAERVLAVLPKRFARFGLMLHPEKTRLVSFQRPRWDGGGQRPGSFCFLGLTHYWARSRKGTWVPRQKTASKRFTRALRAISEWMRRKRHLPVNVQAHLLGLKLRGFYAYYGVRGNSVSMSAFYYEVHRRWEKWLARRSQRRMAWEKMAKLLKQHPLPRPRMRGARQMRLANL